MSIVMEKVDIIVKLKERIAEAKAKNDAIAIQLQRLLDSILISHKNSPAI